MRIDGKRIDCENFLCEEKICDAKSYHKWALKNHPDKFEDPKLKKVAQEVFGKAATCKDHLPRNTFCPKGRKECPEKEAEPQPRQPEPRVLKPKPARRLAFKPPKEPEPEPPEPEPPEPENGKCKQCTATAKSTGTQCRNLVSCRKKANTDFCFGHQPKRGRKSKKSTKK